MEVVHVFDESRTSITSVNFPLPPLPHVTMRNSPDSIARNNKSEGGTIILLFFILRIEMILKSYKPGEHSAFT